MRRFLLPVVTGLSLLAPQGAVADPVVVELFTSQGCSSCPPADEILGELATRDDVIALSLHVDYWDYLGWKDAFAQAAFTNRQRGYAQRAQSTMIYTPQIIVGGADQVIGTKAMKIARLIERHNARPERVKLTVTRSGSDITISAEPLAALPGEVIVYLVEFSTSETVKIESGENAGREMTYHNVVRNWQALGTWDGKAPMRATATLDEDAAGAVILQDGPLGPVLSAARLD